MSLKLKKRETVATGLRRIIRERILSALSELEHFASDPDRAVHDARKRLKEARAVLRLLRPALPGVIYEYERNVYRDAARPLSQLRDTRILLDSLERIAASPGGPLEVTSVKQELEVRRAHLRQQLAEAGLEPVRTALAAAIARLDDWPVAPGEWKTIRTALRRIYRAGRRSMSAASREPGDEKLHEWRKRSKVLWYQLQVLEGLWPGLLEPLAEQVHRLTELLGDDHDLAVLGALVGANGAMGLPPESRRALLERIESKRRDLQQEAFKLGRRLYAEPGRAFTRRLGGYWRAWRDGRLAPEPGPVPGAPD